MSRRSGVDEIRLPSHEEPIPAVTILDGQGRVVRVVPAIEFRRGPVVRRRPIVGRRHGGRSMAGASSADVAVPMRSLAPLDIAAEG